MSIVFAELKKLGMALIAACLLVGIVAGISNSQDGVVSKDHLKAAARAIEASKATESLNDLLPNMVEQTKSLFNRNNPEISNDIEAATDEVALKFLGERLELEIVVREIWAQRFSIEELDAISVFYKSDVGRKLAGLDHELRALTVGAAKQWADKLSTDMVTRVRAELNKRGHRI